MTGVRVHVFKQSYSRNRNFAWDFDHRSIPPASESSWGIVSRLMLKFVSHPPDIHLEYASALCWKRSWNAHVFCAQHVVSGSNADCRLAVN